MNIAFTICSNNYLAQAKVLAESISKFDNGLEFRIFLVDEINDKIDYSNFNCPIIPIHEIKINDFENIWKKYDIVELNTCVKASVFKHIFNTENNCEFALYFDPDIQVFSSLVNLTNNFKTYDILLTPHVVTPIPLDDSTPGENTFLNFGVYNLGFLGLKNKKNSLQVEEFLNWWEERLLKIGYNRVCEGLFVDQLWVNLIPIYYKKVKILLEMGYNAGPWNLHERKSLIFLSEQNIILPDSSKLVFYHFSNFDHKNPHIIAKNYNRIKMEDFEGLKELYAQYNTQLLRANIDFFQNFSCHYVDMREKINSKNKHKKYTIRNIVKNIVPPFIVKLAKKFS